MKVKFREPSKSMVEIGKPTFDPKRAAVGSESRVGEFYYIHIDQLIPFHNQARKSFDEEKLVQLSKTIKEHGIQQPLTIIKAKNKEGFYEVVSGERRLRAAKLAGLEKIPCIIIQNEIEAEEIALIENVQREDLNPLELGEAYKKLIDLGICQSTNKVAEKIGVSKSLVVECIGYTSLPETVKTLILKNNNFSRDFLRTVKSQNSESEMLQLFEKSSKKVITKNIIRIREKSGKLYFSKNNILTLDKKQKEEIKVFLKDIIDIL